jgi:radical SAM superfamily enzyme YgiQ (UPF0313 family)
MKLSLINPSRGKKAKGDFWDFKFEKKILGQTSLIPLFLPTIAGATPRDVETKIIDEKVEEINFDEKVDIVGIGGMTSNISRAYEIADEYRSRGVKVVLGGIHASMMPEEALTHADTVVVGEADCLWPEVISDFKENRLKDIYKFTSYPNPEDIPIPRHDLVKSDRYVINQVQTTRGCPFDCEFCSVKVFSGPQFRLKKIDRIIEEIESLQDSYNINVFGYKLKSPKTLLFADDNLYGNKSHSKKLLEAIIPMKLTDWYCQASINLGKDKEILSMMKQAGCHSMIIGIESVISETLAGYDKKINRVDEYAECLANIQSAGIKVLGSFVLGGDEEDDTVFEKTIKFIRDNNIVYSMVNILTPLPGTRLFKRLDEEGRIINKNWEDYNFETVCFQPKKMSAKALEDGRRWINKEIYSLNDIQKRYDNFMDMKTIKEVTGFEESFTTMSVKEKAYSALLLMKIFYYLNNEQRNFLLNMLKDNFDGKETNLGNTIWSIGFNEYASKL